MDQSTHARIRIIRSGPNNITEMEWEARSFHELAILPYGIRHLIWDDIGACVLHCVDSLSRTEV